jgi:hypothetical protein
MEMKRAKDILREVAEKLPPEATLSDALHELQFRLACPKGPGRIGSRRRRAD